MTSTARRNKRLAELEKLTATIALHDSHIARRNELIRLLIEQDEMLRQDVAKVAGFSPQRVSQIVPALPKADLTATG